MKIRNSIVVLIITMFSCVEEPKQFSEDVLNDSFKTLEGTDISFKEIIDANKGNEVVINVWASWCKDCIVGMPDLKALQNEFPSVRFISLSVDRNEVAWKRSIEKHRLQGDHYFIPDGQKGVFGDFLNSNWIPRYLVIDELGNIKLFKAKKASDNKIRQALL